MPFWGGRFGAAAFATLIPPRHRNIPSVTLDKSPSQREKTTKAKRTTFD
jgi:hypothetical protein